MGRSKSPTLDDDEGGHEVPVAIMPATHIGPVLQDQVFRVGYLMRKHDWLSNELRSNDRKWDKVFCAVKGFEMQMHNRQQDVCFFFLLLKNFCFVQCRSHLTF